MEKEEIIVVQKAKWYVEKIPYETFFSTRVDGSVQSEKFPGKKFT